MRKACVIGWPVAHSLSPVLHRYWLDLHAIDGDYSAEEVQSERLSDYIYALRDGHLAGCSVTLPHKEAVLPLLDAIDPLAQSIGAVNTIIVEPNRKLRGMNTDAFGFMQNIRQQVSLEGKKHKAVVLGAGGAAKAVVKALLDEGFVEVLVVNRTQQKAMQLQEQFGTSVASWEKRDNALEGADLLVNTTSLGLKGKEPLAVKLDALPKAAIVNDIVYNPLMTPLLTEAQARGHKIIDGLGMLLWQGVPAFEAWFGVRPTVDDVLHKHVAARLA